MTEVEVNGTGGVDLDTAATKTALASASTSLRLASLHNLEERLSDNGISFLSNVRIFAHMLMSLWN